MTTQQEKDALPGLNAADADYDALRAAYAAAPAAARKAYDDTLQARRDAFAAIAAADADYDALRAAYAAVYTAYALDAAWAAHFAALPGPGDAGGRLPR